MEWFKRKKKGFQAPKTGKNDVPDGLWVKDEAGNFVTKRALRKNAYVSPEDGSHMRIGSEEYFEILFDDNVFKEYDKDLLSLDPLKFVDNQPYVARLKRTQEKTGLQDAVRTAVGKVSGKDFVIACMDFAFIGGSMGAVVGEKISRAIARACDLGYPVLIICKSGGARMMEAGFSLMQMPKVCAALVALAERRIPYISLLTDPTTGGVSASFGLLGDLNIAEPGALIGFAGPRVIQETIGQTLPKGFQKAEFLLEHGFIDRIVDRRHLKKELSTIVSLLQPAPSSSLSSLSKSKKKKPSKSAKKPVS